MAKNPGSVARGMTRSVFYSAVAEVFPHGLGDSLVTDQVLPDFGATPAQALAQGVDPLTVWQALLRETDKDTEENLFWHRRDFKRK